MGKPDEETTPKGEKHCKLTLPGAKLPCYGSAEAAGLDLVSPQEITIHPGERRLVDTGVQLQIPPGHYGRVASTSGLAYEKSMDVAAGVIDSDYRGNVKVLLRNLGNTCCALAAGSKIAQLICERIS